MFQHGMHLERLLILNSNHGKDTVGLIMIPLSDEWCEDNDVVLNTCYVEGSVDVVNRKWLVHTPTAYIDWIETTPASLIGEYYTGGTMSGIDRVRSFSTEDYSVSGGTWSNKWLQEAL